MNEGEGGVQWFNDLGDLENNPFRQSQPMEADE